MGENMILLQAVVLKGMAGNKTNKQQVSTINNQRFMP